ncbi:MAG: NAD(P)H-hydrate dehydratase, partial [Cyanobacteria bacterium NC_groundwater_1444_Ag_S-0.65um_54_12]|nr:NAD(P)H-hydrate dehydratase [Cyanobacteria bacterium NC_groundwater_1444_Ag_S-0.65um_54_12]
MLATVAETRAAERTVIEEYGIPVELLMERAALGVAALTAQIAKPNEPIAILAGPGHNGGDAVACARILKGWGRSPQLFVTSAQLTPITEQQLRWVRGWEVPVHDLASFRSAPIIVDGIFGFGLNRAPQGELADAIRQTNTADARAIIAIDLPSGTHGDTGVAPGERIVATHTMATGLVKAGTVMDPALDAVGELWQADLGFPQSIIGQLAGSPIICTPPAPRPLNSHKGRFGTLLVVGGSRTMSGAPALAALAAARSGVGMVIVGVPAAIRDVVAGLVPEALVVPLSTSSEGCLTVAATGELSPYLAKAEVLAIGPGLGLAPATAELVMQLHAKWDKPLVLDADALLPGLSATHAKRAVTILTPHAGEAGRLLSASAMQIQADRLTAARSIAERYRACCVLKGGRTIVALPDGHYGVNLRSTPALATAGSGDVLTGLIGGLLAAGVGPFEAAVTGAFLQG